MNYLGWLAVLSAVFVVLERIAPRHRQPIFRRGIAADLFYLVFNGHYLGVGLAVLSVPVISWLDATLTTWGVRDQLYLGVASDWPTWLQFLVPLVVVDFLHWCIHNTLHRVPFLWTLHKVHHSIETMDWVGSLRFHWSEVVVYKSLTYPLLAFLGVPGEVLLWIAVVNTAVGHFNHSNLAVSIGPLKYVLNSPAMHVWHHTHDECGPPLRNFGITLSVWDWLFGTGHIPDHPPERLGFEGIEAFPASALAQLVHPVPIRRILSARHAGEGRGVNIEE